jgi:DNA invertase Pin-like site-specific DNA recombinase
MRLDLAIRTSQRKKEALSPTQQRQIAADFERRTGHEIVAVHDSGKSESGKTMNRASLNAIRERVRAGLTDGAFFAYLDRMGRAPIEEVMPFVRGLVADGGALFVGDWGDEPFDLSRPDVEDMLVMRMQMNRSMWTKAAERQRRNKRDSLAAGKFIGPTPFGYRKGTTVETRGKLVPDETLAPVVREAFRRAAAADLEAARDYLVEVAPNARNWTTTMVRALLGNRTYLGEHAERGYLAGVSDAGETLHYPGHPPLVDAETFNDAQHASRGKRPHSNYLLSGLVKCECGANVVGMTAHGRPPRYRCHRGHYFGATAALDEHIRGECATMLADADVRDRLQPEGVDEAEDAWRTAVAERDAFVAATSALSTDFGAHIAKLDAAVVATESDYRARRAVAKSVERLPAADRMHIDAELRRALTIARSRGLVFEVRRGVGSLDDRVTLVRDDVKDVPGALAA